MFDLKTTADSKENKYCIHQYISCQMDFFCPRINKCCMLATVNTRLNTNPVNCNTALVFLHSYKIIRF